MYKKHFKKVFVGNPEELKQKAESLPNLTVIEDESLETVNEALKQADTVSPHPIRSQVC